MTAFPSAPSPLPSFSRLISPPSACFPSDSPWPQGWEAEGSVLATILLAWPLPASLLFVSPGKQGKNQKVLLPPPYSSNPTAFRAFGGREFSKKKVTQNFLCRNQSGNPAGLQKEWGLSEKKKPHIPFSVWLWAPALTTVVRSPFFFSFFVVRVCMLSHPMDCIPWGASVHGILQARILEWVAMPSFRGSSRSRDWTCISCV